MNRIAVIGAGISGLSVAHLLKEKGYSVTIYERSDKPGGLIKCSTEKSGLFHRVGGHVFNSKNQFVLDWFFSFFDKEKEFLKSSRNSQILYENRKIGYPIENYLYQFDSNTIDKITSELLSLRHLPTDKYSDFESFLKNNFGETLYQMYFGPYNSKIWNTDLKEVPLDWLDGKLPMPNLKEIFLSNIQRNKESEMVHSTFFYPQKGGSSFIAERLAEGLEIKYNTNVKKISYTGEKWNLNNQLYDFVVFTGDIRTLADLLLIDRHSWKIKNILDTEDFQSNGTTTVFCETDDTDLSWLYIPEKDKEAHRIIYTGNFSPNNNTARKTCTVEFSGIVNQETIEKNLSKLPGNLIPIARNIEANSYVIQGFNTRKIVNSIKNELQASGFFLLGRFAEWEYYNMDKAIEAAMLLSDNFERK